MNEENYILPIFVYQTIIQKQTFIKVIYNSSWSNNKNISLKKNARKQKEVNVLFYKNISYCKKVRYHFLFISKNCLCQDLLSPLYIFFVFKSGRCILLYIILFSTFNTQKSLLMIFLYHFLSIQNRVILLNNFCWTM